MLPDRVSNPGPLTYESGVLPIALHGPANLTVSNNEIITLDFTVLGVGISRNCLIHLLIY